MMNQEHRNRLEHLSVMYIVKNSKYGKYGRSFDKGMDEYGIISWSLRDDDISTRIRESILKEIGRGVSDESRT